MALNKSCRPDANPKRKYRITVTPFSGTPVPSLGKFIPSLQSILDQEPQTPLVMYYRVSTEDQRKNGNLVEGIADLQASLQKRGVSIDEKGYFEVRKGSDLSRADALRDACARADQIHGVVVTTHVNRFVRPSNFHPYRNPNASYTQNDMKALGTFFGKTRFCTLYDPDTPASAIRGQQTQRGMQAKQRMGGRPRKKDRVRPGTLKKRRCIKQPRAIRLRNKGWSYPKIADCLKVPLSTVVDWIKNVEIHR